MNEFNLGAYSSAAYTMTLPEGHKFPMYKYAGVRDALALEGVPILDPPRLDWALVERVHTPEYLRHLRFGTLEPKALRLLGFPWSPALVERALRAAGGTVVAARDALQYGLGVNLAGGTHHAYPDHGEGFCALNDVAIAIFDLFDRGLDRILVLDLDVHQGNGTAHIFEHDPRVFTLSVHGERNYPFHKERSSLDIGLPDWTQDAAYLEILDARVFPALKAFQPQLVFFLAGVDVLARDQFGRFSLSLEGAFERDRRVFEFCRAQSLPVVSVMSGGYNKTFETTVMGHANTVRAARGVWNASQPSLELEHTLPRTHL
jgi:acetoin utilization deacetylase AcuC-like enzyme